MNFTDNPPEWLNSPESIEFFRTYYEVYALFLPIGGITINDNTEQRMFCAMCGLVGRLFVFVIPVASLALIIGLYISPAERFLSRFRIITSQMKLTRVPEEMQQKVETFYKMYWHKQKAVSKTELLATFPPALITAINTDVYFEAVQKSQVLRDLSYQFLSEITKFMTTINYVPGDIILRRDSTKKAIIYITYGDVEMLTAEDDETPVLRFCRGTIINPCGGCVEVGSALSHVTIRASTFCTAHVLHTKDLWKTAYKYGKYNGQSFILHSSFEEHFEKVKRHYAYRPHPQVLHKSSIAVLKRNLMDLKEAKDQFGRLLLGRSDMFLQIAGCYLMRNRKDSSLAEESDAICLRPTFPYILQPSSSLLIFWHCSVSVISVASVLTLLYEMTFMKTQTLSFFNHIISTVFIADIIIYLSTGAKLEEGVPITFTHTSSEQIKSYWFVLDILAVIPFFEFIGEGHFTGLNKMFKIPKVFRVLKSLENVFMSHINLLRFFSYVLLVFLVWTMMSCIVQYFNCYILNSCLIKSFVQAPMWAGNTSLDDDMESRFVFSHFWTIGIIALTDHRTKAYFLDWWKHLVYTMLLIEVCVLLHVVTRATYCASVMANAAVRDAYVTCIKTVNSFFINNDLDPTLRRRYTTYLKLCWYTDKAYSITHDKDSVTFDLPVHVNHELLNLQHSKYISCLPFMKIVNAALLKEVSSQADLFYTSPNEILLNTGDISNEVYVIKQGYCEMFDPKTKKVTALLGPRSYFGTLECILRIPAYYTVKAVTHVQLFSMSRKNLEKVIALRGMKNAIRYARSLPEYEALQTQQKQFLEYQVPAKAPNREYFPLPRKHIPDYAFLHPFHRLGFFSVLRYVFPRFTIRPDSTYMRRYEWFRCICAICSACICPLFYTLRLQWNFFIYILWFLDISAYYDIFQRFLVGYFDSSGILVYHPASTAAHYLKGAFLMDLIACLPLEELDSMRNRFDEVLQATIYTGTTQLLMNNRILQLYRVPRTLHDLRVFVTRPDILFVIKAIPFLVAVIVMLTSTVIEGTVTKYLKRDGGFILKNRLKDVKDCWTARFEKYRSYKILARPLNLIITGLYCTTSDVTAVGAGVIRTNDQYIMTLLIISLFSGTIFTTYCAVRIISSRCSVNQALVTYQEYIKDIDIFMKKEKLDSKLYREVLQYYEYIWEKTGGTDYRSVLQLCDQISLRTDAILHIYGQTFSKCAILADSDISLFRILGRAVFSVYYRQGMVVIERDDVISDMYFIDSGTLDIRYPDDDEHILTKLPRGSVFGSLDDVETQVCRNRFIACTDVHILKVNSKLFYTIVKEFPSVRILMNTYRPKKQNYIIGGVKVKGRIATVWKERVQSNALIVVTHEGIMKTFHAHKNFVQIYLIIVSLACVMGDIYNAGFQDNNIILIAILYFLDFCFLMKVIINLTMPYITAVESESRNVLISNRNRYYKGEFRFDIITCLPIEILCLFSSSPWFVFAYLRLNRFFRIVTVNKCLARFHEKLKVNVTFSSIVEIFIFFMLYLHISACIWYNIGLLEEMNKPGSSWFYPADGDINVYAAYDPYLASMYFIISMITLTGYQEYSPTIAPKQLVEIGFLTILYIIAAFVYIILMGECARIIHYHSFRAYSYFSKYLELQEFLKSNRVAYNLIRMSKAYSLYLWRESRGMQMPKFLEDAPQVLKEKVMCAAYMMHVHEHPVFSQCEPAFLRQLVTCLKPYYYSEDLYVVKEGEMSGAMYFIHEGQVQELDEDMEEKLKLQGLHHDVAYTLSYKTLVRCQVLTLSIHDWKYLLNHYPKSKNAIYPPKAPPAAPQAYVPPPPKVVVPPTTDDQDRKKVQITKDPDEVKQFTRESKTQLDGNSEMEMGTHIWEEIEDAATENLGIIQEEKAIPPASVTNETDTVVESPGPLPEEQAVDFSLYPTIRRRETKPLETATGPEETKLEETGQELAQSIDKKSLVVDVESVPLTEFDNKYPPSEPSATKDNKDETTSIPIKQTSSESEMEEQPKPSYRRKSMVHGIDRSAVERELASISAQDIQQPAELPFGTSISPENIDLEKNADSQELDQKQREEEPEPKSEVVHLVTPSERHSRTSFISEVTKPQENIKTRLSDEQSETVAEQEEPRSEVVHMVTPSERHSTTSFISEVTKPQENIKTRLSDEQGETVAEQEEPKSEVVHLVPPSERHSATSFISEVTKLQENIKARLSKEQGKTVAEQEKATFIDETREEEPKSSSKFTPDQPSTSQGTGKRPRAGLAFEEPAKTSKEEDSKDKEGVKEKAARSQSIWGVEDFMMDEDSKNAKKQSTNPPVTPTPSKPKPGKFKLNINNPTPLSDDESKDKKPK